MVVIWDSNAAPKKTGFAIGCSGSAEATAVLPKFSILAASFMPAEAISITSHVHEEVNLTEMTCDRHLGDVFGLPRQMEIPAETDLRAIEPCEDSKCSASELVVQVLLKNEITTVSCRNDLLIIVAALENKPCANRASSIARCKSAKIAACPRAS